MLFVSGEKVQSRFINSKKNKQLQLYKGTEFSVGSQVSGFSTVCARIDSRKLEKVNPDKGAVVFCRGRCTFYVVIRVLIRVC